MSYRDELQQALVAATDHTWDVRERIVNRDAQYRCTPEGEHGVLTRCYDVDARPDVRDLAQQIIAHQRRYVEVWQ